MMGSSGGGAGTERKKGQTIGEVAEEREREGKTREERGEAKMRREVTGKGKGRERGRRICGTKGVKKEP